MNTDEIKALAQIVSRCQMSQAEALWINTLFERELFRAKAEAGVRQAQEAAKEDST